MLRINKFEEKITGFREIDGNLLGLLNFYFMDILNIIMYLLGFFVLVKIRKDSVIDLDFIEEELWIIYKLWSC